MTIKQLAAQYIQDQLGIIRKHGGAPHLSADRRRVAIEDAQRTFEAMRERAVSVRSINDTETETARKVYA